MIADGPSANRPPHIVLEPPVLSSRSLTAAILGLTLMVAGCSRETGEPAQPAETTAPTGVASAGVIDRSRKGSEIPDLVFADATGKKLELVRLKGKPVLLNLWATWCAPCVAEMPALDRLAASKGDAVHVVSVSQDLRQPEKVGAFFKERKLAWLDPWLDPENQLSDHYQVQVLPTTVYYDANGREVWRYVGPREWGDAETAKLLDEAK
jgi:thiol-disulfide isomerase/thioredoxin